MSAKNKRPIIDIIELLQDGGGLPEVTVEHSCTEDWVRILTDAHSDLTRQICYYLEDEKNHLQVTRCLLKIEAICKAWREKGPKE